MCLFSRWKLESAITIATARFAGTRDAATASTFVIRLVFPDVRATLASEVLRRRIHRNRHARRLRILDDMHQGRGGFITSNAEDGTRSRCRRWAKSAAIARSSRRRRTSLSATEFEFLAGAELL